MSLRDIRGSLEAHLNAMSPAIKTVWDNQPKPETAAREAWQRCKLVPAEPRNDEVSAAYVEQGYLSIELLYPPLAGAGAADQRAQMIRDAFPRGLSLSQGGVITSIERTPWIGAGFSDADGRWVVPVRIRFFTPINDA